MSIQKPIPFSKLIEALLDETRPFHPRYLHRLSDLEPEDASLLAKNWPNVSLRRREALLEDLEEHHMADDLLWFEEVGRLALRDKDASVRIRAINILREYELIDLLPTFVDMAQNDPDAGVRAGAATALGTYVYMGEVEDISATKLKRVEDCLLNLFYSSDVTLVRRRALEALGFSSRKEVNGLIRDAYASGDIDWLTTALLAMGHSANSLWKPQVLNMINHTHPGVRAEAASAAGELEIVESVPMLLELLDDPDMDVRMASIWALSQLGGNGVREALEGLRENTDLDEEADQIDNALENLDFTEEMKDLALMEIPENGNGAELPSEADDNKDETVSEDEED